MLLGIPEQDQEALRDRSTTASAWTRERCPTSRTTVPSQRPAPVRRLHRLAGGAPLRRPDDRAAHRPSSRTRPAQPPPDPDEVLNYVNLLAAAGNETTTRLIGWTGKVLAEYPDQRQQTRRGPEPVPNAIEELLRFEPPSPVQARYVTQDVEHYGQAVPEGSAMLLLNGSAQPGRPEFPRRRPLRHPPQDRSPSGFGYGLHFCLGAALARLEGRVALDEVLKRFPRWEVDWDNAEQARTSDGAGLGAPPGVVHLSRTGRPWVRIGMAVHRCR